MCPRRARLASVVALSVAVVGMLAGPAGAAAPRGPAFSLRPVERTEHGYYRVSARPGAVIERTLRVTNTGPKPATVRLAGVDATTGATSGAVYRGPTDPRRDVGAWIALSRTSIRLAPKRSAFVHLRLRVPRSSWSGQHLGGIVAWAAAGPARPTSAQSARKSFRVDVVQQTIVAVQADVPGPAVKRLELTGAEMGGSPGFQTVLLGLRNTGGRMLKARGKLVVQNKAGQVLKRQAFSIDTFVPRTSIEMPVVVRGDALRAGDYTVSVSIAYGGHAPVELRTPATVSSGALRQAFGGQATRLGAEPPGGAGPPVAAIGGILAVLLLFGGAVLLAVRSRRRAESLRLRLEQLEAQSTEQLVVTDARPAPAEAAPETTYRR